jgi:hypothetical protein
MGLEQRVDKLEQSIGTQAGLGCDRCRDEAYFPDVVNTEDRYYCHFPCGTCGRLRTLCFQVVYTREEALASACEGVR